MVRTVGKLAAKTSSNGRLVFLLSPAKSLSFDEHQQASEASPRRPLFPSETRVLVETMKSKTKGELRRLMNISEPLAALNHERYRSWDSGQEGRAGFVFDGPAFRHLRCQDMTNEQLSWLDDRLFILSGLYGLIRPLDSIKPYRLEMGTKLKTSKGASLYEFWRHLTDRLLSELDEGDTVVNVASKEYSSCVDFEKLISAGCSVLEIKFPGPAVYAKQARGAIVRWACENQVSDLTDLRDWCGDAGEFEFEGEESDSSQKRVTFTFRRDKAAADACKRGKGKKLKR
mmetsp:Transcript_10105/g.34906  ORF Transcript_10105/g.34906 Transcript_10105/m.34906 type:complete len:286 (+) Transcript_10105:92-949(+)